MILGAQLYTVREFCKDTESLEKSLERVAEIGYASVQLSGVCAYDPMWMKALLERLGLTADITHFDINKIADDTEKTIEHHRIIGCRHIGIGSNPFGSSPEGVHKLWERLSPALTKIAGAGQRFMYHNHDHEFARFDGETCLELMCRVFPQELMGITLDAYWAQAGGEDPARLIRALEGRVNCVHLKDMVYSAEDKKIRMAPVGSGNMNYPEIIRACRDAGVTHVFVEQDNCYGEDPFLCLEKSFKYLSELV